MKKIKAVCVVVSMLVYAGFSAPKPIWISGAEREMNAFYGFAASFEVEQGDDPVLNFSASSIARVYVNGRLAAYGPARSPEGYMRIDRWPLSNFVRAGKNIVAIEVSNPAVNTFYLPERDGFVFAEVKSSKGRTLAETGKDFKAILLPRIRKTNRFSYQREFGEFYVVTPESYSWREKGVSGAGLPVVDWPMLNCLERGAPYPTLAFDGTFRPSIKTKMRRDRTKVIKKISCIENGGVMPYKGFRKEELEVDMGELQRYVLLQKASLTSIGDAGICKDGDGIVFVGGAEVAGFPCLDVDCIEPATVWILMDEFAGEDGLPNMARFHSCANACGWRLERPGHYKLECFQPNGVGCAHVLIEKGAVVIRRFDVRTYVNPMPARASFKCSDAALEKIFAAAGRSLANNAVDLFTDCPGRERGAYFGDTTFTGRGGDVLLGDVSIEGTLFENFSLAGEFKDVPKGMIPMCYPADVVLSEPHWIPAFGLWSVVELSEYVRRSGDRRIAGLYRHVAEGLLKWFRASCGSEGLLENLPGWVFVEWSGASQFTAGINVPTNMIYIRFLRAFAELYGRKDCDEEADRLRKVLRNKAWTGEWFSDQLIRGENGNLVAGPESTEVCQTLAFFSKVATREEDPDLWKRFVEDLGPMRTKDKWPRIWPSNMLFGFSLRFGVLTECGYDKRVLDEVRTCCLPMAERTGALWESTVETAGGGFSACHGFPCQAAWVIVRSALGVKRIDRSNRRVSIGRLSPNIGLEWCDAVLPLTNGESMRIRWSRNARDIDVQVELPKGWTKVEN